ncbi:MAG: mucoidy inhibitor MuiA family protein [Planctomycetes bacterium]|nr:mucoidy inhibitor MuiA family protein [Planctomycetota bacterium]
MVLSLPRSLSPVVQWIPLVLLSSPWLARPALAAVPATALGDATFQAASAPGRVETPLATSITEVSIHRASAIVKRRATLDGDGRYLVRDLPPTLVPDSIRLRLIGAVANNLTVRPAEPDRVAPERLAAAQSRLDALVEQRQVAADALSLQSALRQRIERLLTQEATADAQASADGRPDPGPRDDRFGYLTTELRTTRAAERLARLAFEAAEAALTAARDELGPLASHSSAPRFDLAFDVVAQVEGEHALELEYEVTQARWSPRYDLRADGALAAVDLVYRAEVVQESGEDWRDVTLHLSTAEPRRGVVGPTARGSWVDFSWPTPVTEFTAGFAAGAERAKRLDDSLDAESDDDWHAEAQPEGLSVRYQLPRKETIESRADATTVLVTRATLAVEGERVCTPSADLDVWIRARTRNDTAFLMLPGPAAVFFGDDFIGPAALERVRPGQEFTLHLGRDPGFTVTRHHVDDRRGSAGLFGSKVEQVDRWRIRVENRAGLSVAPDGRVLVQVRESLPIAKDDRIEVELGDVKPPLARSDRFDRARAEKGILTWELPIARGAAAEIEWKQTVTWPEDAELLESGGLLAARRDATPPTHGAAHALRRASAPSMPQPIALTLALALLAALGALTRHLYRRLCHRLRRTTPQGAGLATPLALLLLAAGTRSAAAQESVASRLDRVTVYGSGALVERLASLPSSGTFVLRDLPASAAPDSIRVRVEGGEVVAVELRERREANLPDAALAQLRERHRALELEVAALEDERATLEQIDRHLQLRLVPATPSATASGRPTPASWSEEAAFLAREIAAQQAARRALATALAAKQRELAAAARELAGGSANAARVRDVIVDVVARAAGPLPCRISYLVADAGWQPEYELRAAATLDRVALAYRARVWQATAERWDDVALALSTAAPQRGAAGPDPQRRTLALRDPVQHDASFFRRDAAAPVEALAAIETQRAAAPATRPVPIATVTDQGISEHFELPGRQRVDPGRDGQLLLIGTAELPLAIERRCVPAQDLTVWLTGKATNDSAWTLLPGATAVHLGNDYLGRGTLALTPKGSALTLALGSDPWLAVERVELADDFATSSFSSAGTLRRAWRLAIRDHGAPARDPRGLVVVQVEETLPRARDEQIEVTLEESRPAPRKDASAQRRRDESGILTFELAVPRDGTASLEWGYRVRYPAERLLSFIDE